MGKLALLGGLRGTKLELKGALEALKEAQRGINGVADCLILGLGGWPYKYLSKLRYC